jgi:hypothetical protein
MDCYKPAEVGISKFCVIPQTNSLHALDILLRKQISVKIRKFIHEKIANPHNSANRKLKFEKLLQLRNEPQRLQQVATITGRDYHD